MPNERFLRVGLMSAFGSDLAFRRVVAAQRVRDRHYPNWSLHVVDGAFGLKRLGQLRVDGLIAEGSSLVGAPDLDLPLVHYGGAHRPGSPWVDTDHIAVGKLAATTLRATNRASYAHITWPLDEHVWVDRWQGFHDGCGAAAPVVHVFNGFEDLARFLRSLTLPTGLFCANDVLGQWAIDACHEVGLLVPDDVAIVGVDNDAVICPIISPPLSSIAQDEEGMFTALFDLLDRVETGRPTEAETRIPPLRVVHRRSTGLDPHQDLAQKAMALIRTDQETTVTGLAGRLGVTQRSVQRAMLAAYGMSPLSAIRNTRIARAKRLLAAGLSIAEVAAQVGYASLSAFNETFRSVSGASPGSWLEKQSKD